MANHRDDNIEQYLSPADAGNSFTSAPYVQPDEDQSDPFRSYEGVRGNDKILSVLQNKTNLQFTEDDNCDYLRLLMPMYPRRVEVEDLNRNFWVIGQTINFISRKIRFIDSGGTDPGVERLKFEKTIEKDRDLNDYSNYPHKIIFNEGVDGIKTPYMIKDYCYRSNELSSNFEGEVIWYRQFGGVNSADQGYIVGGGGNTPFLNFYKPRPDAIPIFNLIQTESSDTESFNAGDQYKKLSNERRDAGASLYTEESVYMNYLGKTDTFLFDGDNCKVKLSNILLPSDMGDHSDLDANGEYAPTTSGVIVTANVPELTPMKVYQGGTINGEGYPPAPTALAGHSDITVRSYGSDSEIKFEQFTEGQLIHFVAKPHNQSTTDSQFDGYYVKAMLESTIKNGYTVPKNYVWKKVISNYEYNISSQADKSSKYICKGVNVGALFINFTDQEFMWNNNKWRCLDNMVLRDGPTVPEYRVVENGSAFRVLGDSSRAITEGSSTKPIINYKEIATANIHAHDVVRYIDPNGPTHGKCFEWWDGKWREIKNCDASYVNIFLWLPQKTNTLRGVYYWTLKWLIPPGLVEY